MSNMQKRSAKDFARYIPLFLIALVAGIFIFIAQQKSEPTTQAQQAGTFSFGVAGDYGGNSNTDGVLTAIKNSGVNFQLAVGDLSYDTKGSPAGWGSYVKNILGTLPFVLVSGNHDESKIDQFVAALPNPMSGVSGTYGNQYYFDYPTIAPLARFIMISPNVLSADPTWINSSIDSARSAGIRWIIVGMHKNCITTGQKSCEIGQALLTQLLSKKVDLILQGHDHNYQRSKQLTCATVNTFTASCVANAGSNYTQGAGSVLLIVGTGGNGHYAVSTTDAESGYFSVINGDTLGFAKFTITPDKLAEQFVRTAGGNLTDSFTITRSGATIPSTALPSPTLNPSPTASFVLTPTYSCLGPCPTLAETTPLPGETGTVAPTAALSVTEPTAGEATIEPTAILSVTPEPAPDPCVATAHAKGQNPGQGAVRGFMQFLLELLTMLINLLSKLLGGNGNIVSPPITACP